MRVGAVLAALLLLGCAPPVTEVLIVVASDVTIDVSTRGFVAASAGGAAPLGQEGFSSSLTQLPFTVSVVSQGQTTAFSADVSISSSSRTSVPLLIQRGLRGVQFEEHETRMLIVPLLSACACHGTQCPAPGIVECDDLNDPPLIPFDLRLATDNAAALASPGAGVADGASPDAG